MEPTILEGDHVRLEPLSMNHLDDLCRHGLEEHLWTWIPQPVQTRNDMAGYIEAALAGQKTGTMLPFATIAKESGEAVGSTRFGNIDLENRRMEIGVRKVLGATSLDTVRMLVSDLMKPVFVALLIAVPLGWGLTTSWLNSFAYHPPQSFVIIVVTVTICFFVALISVIGQGTRAANWAPMRHLSSE